MKNSNILIVNFFALFIILIIYYFLEISRCVRASYENHTLQGVIGPEEKNNQGFRHWPICQIGQFRDT